jgi:hypothetical protein
MKPLAATSRGDFLFSGKAFSFVSCCLIRFLKYHYKHNGDTCKYSTSFCFMFLNFYFRKTRSVDSEGLRAGGQSPLILQMTLHPFEHDAIHHVADGDDQNHDGDHSAHIVQVASHH